MGPHDRTVSLFDLWVETLVDTMPDDDYPIEVGSLSHPHSIEVRNSRLASQVSNAPTEAINNLIKRTKRIAVLLIYYYLFIRGYNSKRTKAYHFSSSV